MIDLIATDLDGTLLQTNGDISDGNREAIQYAQSKGIEVVVATGRSFESAKRPLDRAGLNCPIICLNGANSYNKEGEQVLTIDMNKDLIQAIIQTVEKENAYLELYTNHGIYSKDLTDFKDVLINMLLSNHPEVSREEVEKRANQRFQEETFIFTEDLSSILMDERVHIYKALAFSIEADALERIRRSLDGSDGLKMTSSGVDNIEFNHPEAQKGITLKKWIQPKSIDPKNVLAIGDNYNDLSMLEWVGYSIAMDNADLAIKQKCFDTTASNDEDGVKQAIYKYINN
ncbi:hypothetical protein SAMN05421734_106147 [Pelagirhabdus alkalitolerans]|uniref:Cof subfamily of IIB subfamily of haloacid dehalogenase superfamily/HAD-superfamily hydrolase, subfamily IIB n=1 Tax=Pelagirhabdus alkalitolerans TaxID=1612202 RepID=A0A1G6KN93_9BACI|nr:Cof-type HAD-IIB family hydrolase [Pelagirhabdus alkalitolerans]SDC32443.1 hypothetical protein SAMN05421734_106147 [Pelagirhabdus alkalitolerans]